MSGMFRLAACDERDQGLEEIELALRLDPLSQAMNFSLAWNYLFAGDLRRARQQAQATLNLFPSSVQSYYAVGLSELGLGNTSESIAALEKAAAIARDPLSLGYLGCACGVAGDKERTRELLAEVTAIQRNTFVALKPFIVLHLGLGEYDRAIDYVEEAYRVRDPILFHMTRVPIFDPLAGDPRFRAVIRRVPTLSASKGGGATRRARRSGAPQSRSLAPSGTRSRPSRSNALS
jgi:tetratricopeptide (TPR) repeat protein